MLTLVLRVMNHQDNLKIRTVHYSAKYLRHEPRQIMDPKKWEGFETILKKIIGKLKHSHTNYRGTNHTHTHTHNDLRHHAANLAHSP